MSINLAQASIIYSHKPAKELTRVGICRGEWEGEEGGESKVGLEAGEKNGGEMRRVEDEDCSMEERAIFMQVVCGWELCSCSTCDTSS